MSRAQHTVYDIEKRVESLETYVETFQPTLDNFSTHFQKSINGYTQALEESLQGYSTKLKTDIEDRLRKANQKTVILDPLTKTYQRIETNAVSFLIAVDKMEIVEGGVRVYLIIGNPNYADFNEFKLKIFWGKQWIPTPQETYEQWRTSLTGAEFTFKRPLKRGKWTPVQVDLTPALTHELGHIECEMEISSIELEFDTQ